MMAETKWWFAILLIAPVITAPLTANVNLTIGIINWYCLMPGLSFNGSHVTAGNFSGGIYDYSVFDLSGYDALVYLVDLAVQTAVEHINGDPSILPGAFVNLKRFSDCGEWNSGILDAWPFYTGGYASSIMAKEISEDHRDVIGVVSLEFSGVARGNAQVLSNHQIPYCSGAISSPRFSNKNKYPYFWRTASGIGSGESFFQVLKYMKVSRVAIVYQKTNDLGYYNFMEIQESLQKHKISILWTFGMESAADPLMLDYTVETLKRSSARYIILCGYNEFAADFIFGVGKRGLIDENHVYMGTNYPIPFQDANSLYGPEFFEYIRGFIKVDTASANTHTSIFQERRNEFNKFTGYNFTNTDIVFNSMDVFYDCIMTMAFGWNSLLSSSSIQDLSKRKLNHLMNHTLFRNTGYHGMIADPLVLTDEGETLNIWKACSMTGRQYNCRAFGQTNLYLTEFVAYQNVTPVFWPGKSEFPDDGSDKREAIILLPDMPVGATILVLAVVGMFAALSISYILWKSRHHPAVKSLSLPEASICLVGSAITYTSLLFYLGSVNATFCKLRTALSLLGVAMIQSALIFKSVLMISLFGKKYVRKPALLALRLRTANALVIALDAALLVAWVFEGKVGYQEKASLTQVYVTCVPLPSVLLSAAFYLCILLLLLVLPTVALLQRVRWEQYNQSTPLMILSICILFGFVVLREDEVTSYLYEHDLKLCAITWANVSICLVLQFKASISELFKDLRNRQSAAVISSPHSPSSTVHKPYVGGSRVGNTLNRVSKLRSSDQTMPASSMIPYHRKLLCNTVDCCIYKIRTGRKSWSNWRAGQAEMHGFRSKEWLSLNSALNTACFHIGPETQIHCAVETVTISLESKAVPGRKRIAFNSTDAFTVFGAQQVAAVPVERKESWPQSRGQQ
ncbi:periplasmic binding protein-like I [Chytriomyces cf. hyalinus JEL632]|nr:periplasmic binding protein-like I [Chytriomyces cf. hyalinus JEL632]